MQRTEITTTQIWTIFAAGLAGFAAGVVTGAVERDPPAIIERIEADRCPPGTYWMVDWSGKPSCWEDVR